MPGNKQAGVQPVVGWAWELHPLFVFLVLLGRGC